MSKTKLIVFSLTFAWLAALACGYLLLLNFSVTNKQDNLVAAPSVVAPVKDPELEAQLQSVARDKVFASTIGITYVDGYSDSARRGEATSSIDNQGRTVGSNITVQRNAKGYQPLTIVAHEYLHAVWRVMSEDRKADLTQELNRLYQADPSMQDRMQYYVDKGILQPTELFSIYCTESSDSYLSPYVIAKCNDYIDRSKLHFVR